MEEMEDEDLPSSVLGTKEHWKTVYKSELSNFKEFGDVGEIWFGKGNTERVVKWLEAKVISKTAAILDIGCGNGVMLLRLYEAGFHNLYGIDYVEEAVELADTIAKEKSCPEVKFEVVDILSDLTSLPTSCCLHNKYGVIIDKGTYDAISLCPENGKAKRETYKRNITKILDEDGIFILVSCNWTRDELLSHFKEFKLLDEIPTPCFTFGGKAGHTVTSLVMQKC